MKTQIWLNKKNLIGWNKNKTAFCIRSPKNKTGVIWFSSKLKLNSKFSDEYFGVVIYKTNDYYEHFYSLTEQSTRIPISVNEMISLFEEEKKQIEIDRVKFVEKLNSDILEPSYVVEKQQNDECDWRIS